MLPRWLVALAVLCWLTFVSVCCHPLTVTGADGNDGRESPAERWRRNHRIDKRDKSSPMDISSTDSWWVPVTVVTVFCVMLLGTRKLTVLKGRSLRDVLNEFFCLDCLYRTLDGATVDELLRERRYELGHQAMIGLGVALIIVLAVMLLTSIADLTLLGAGFVRPVRSVNTKLRFAHCVYQVFLFCADAISTQFSLSVPVDCFVWASVHYMYEAIAMMVSGSNMNGLTEVALVVLVNAQLVTSTSATVGWRALFALSALGLSSVSMIVGLVWKLCHLNPEDRLPRRNRLAIAADIDEPLVEDHTPTNASMATMPPPDHTEEHDGSIEE